MAEVLKLSDGRWSVRTSLGGGSIRERWILPRMGEDLGQELERMLSFFEAQRELDEDDPEEDEDDEDLQVEMFPYFPLENHFCD